MHVLSTQVLHYTKKQLTENEIQVITSISFNDDPNIVLDLLKVSQIVSHSSQLYG